MNFQMEQLQTSLVKEERRKGNLVGMWYIASANLESGELWEKAFRTCGGIDFFYSDRPVEAMAARDAIQTVAI